MDYVENLLQSIDQVVYHRLRDQKFDETIICTVTDTSKASRGLYVVSDGTIKFDAYSELTDYKVDEAVRVNIPKGDYSQKKYIIGRSVSEKNGNQPIVYNSPSAEILDISGNLCTSAKAKIIANGSAKEVLIWSNERLSEDYANSIYDSILISAQFQTFFSPYNVSKGTYGLRLKVIIAPKKASDKTICREYDLDSRDMFGDPYNYLLPSLQEAKFNFDVNENIQQMSLYLYQNDDFMYKNDTGTEQRLGIALMENIHASKIHIGLGTNLSTIEDNTVKIYTDDDLTYNSINGTNQKTIKLIWYNKDDNNRYVGFSDGIVDASYNEMNYDKDMNNHNRLIAQASQGNIPNDYAGFELGARMSEINAINTSLKKLIDKDLYSDIKKFKNALAPIDDENIDNAFKEIITYIEKSDEDYNEGGQLVLKQLDGLYDFYDQGLKLAAAASQGVLQYSNSEKCYYIITDKNENKREKIDMVSDLRSDNEQPLFGIALDEEKDDEGNGINRWPYWQEVDKTKGSLGKLIDTVEDQLSSIKANVVSKAANYLSTYNNWQIIINNILTQIEKYTLDLQKLSMGQAYPMYSLKDKVPGQELEPKKKYSSSALFESDWDGIWEEGEGLLNRIIESEDVNDNEEFESYTLARSQYTRTDKIDNNGDDVDDNANKYQIYWYYERNGYTPGEGENPYGGPGWCEIGDNGSNNNVSRFTILNTEKQGNKEVIVKNIGLPKPIDGKFPTKSDENDENGYLSISFSSNRPDIKEEKIKCVVIYNHEKYESNILTFKNEDPAAGPELTNAIQLIHGKNSRDIYSCYNADNILTNASDKVTPRELKIEYLNERGEPETGEDSTLIGSTVYWYVPTGITMLTVDNKDLGIDETDDNEGFVCGSACERMYKVYRSISKVYYGNQLAQQSQEEPNIWRIRVDNNNIEFEFGETGAEVRILCNQTVVSEQVISKSNFTYNNTTCKVEFSSIDKLEYTATRAIYNKDNKNYYVYNAKEYQTTGDPPPGATIQLSNNLVTLLFEYTKNQTKIFQNLSYGGITYAPSQDCCSIISGDGKSITIKSGYVTLTVDEPDDYDKEGFAYYYKTINSIDDLTFKYRIKEHYSQSSVNNTILCKVVKNNRVLEDSKIFTFSSQGVNGTNYSLVISPEYSSHAFISGEYQFNITLFDYDGNQIPFSSPPQISTNISVSGSELQAVKSNEKGTLQYNGTITISGDNVNKPHYLTVTSCQPWPLGSDNEITLKVQQPIAQSEYRTYIADVPSVIIYDSAGTNPSYYKNPLTLYEKDANENLTLVKECEWSISYYVDDASYPNTDNWLSNYAPILQGEKIGEGRFKNGTALLKPCNMYLHNYNLQPVLECKRSGENGALLWSQPIKIMQNNFPSALLNNWDGSLQIDVNGNTILSSIVGAGIKNKDNSFSGVLMGDVYNADINNINGGVFSNPHTGLGLYGFHNGSQSFGFNVDGTAFIGKAGGGRIAFDGNQGFIYSANWLNSDSFQTEDGRINTSKAFPLVGDGSQLRTIGKGEAGMAIDLTNGHIDAYDFKLSSQGIQLNASPKDNESYFIIGDDTDNSKSCLKYNKNGTLSLRVDEFTLIGTASSANLLNNTGPWFYTPVGSTNHIDWFWKHEDISYLVQSSHLGYKWIRISGVSEINGGVLSQVYENQLQKDKTYTLTGRYYIDDPSTIQSLTIDFGDNQTHSLQVVSDYGTINIKHTPSQNCSEFKILCYKKPGANSAVVDFAQLKLERGESATKWSASASDISLQSADSYLDQERVFNKLTNNATQSGIYLTDSNQDGKKELYINADYIQTGAINAKLIKTGIIKSQDEKMQFDLDNGTFIAKKGFHLRAEADKNTSGTAAMVLQLTNSPPTGSSYFFIGQQKQLNDGTWQMEKGIRYGWDEKLQIITNNFKVLSDGDVIVKGKIEANDGKIADWTITPTSLIHGTPGEAGAVGLYASSQNETTEIANHTSSEWRLIAGPNFGVTISGEIYAVDAHIAGTINANSGNIAGWTIENNCLIHGTPTQQGSVCIYVSGSNSEQASLTVGNHLKISENGEINSYGWCMGSRDLGALPYDAIWHSGSTDTIVITSDKVQFEFQENGKNMSVVALWKDIINVANNYK